MERLKQYCSECQLLEEFGEKILERSQNAEELRSALPEIEEVVTHFYEGDHRKTEQEYFLPWIKENSSANLQDLFSAIEEERRSISEVSARVSHQRDLESHDLKSTVEELGRLLVHIAFTKAHFACNVVSLLSGNAPCRGGDATNALEPWRVVLKTL